MQPWGYNRMDDSASFGEWLRRRRRALDLTQADLAQRAGLATTTVRKIEADARRPSRQVAARLADVLGLADVERGAFVQVARAERAVEWLDAPLSDVSPDAEPQSSVSATNLPLPLTRFYWPPAGPCRGGRPGWGQPLAHSGRPRWHW